MGGTKGFKGEEKRKRGKGKADLIHQVKPTNKGKMGNHHNPIHRQPGGSQREKVRKSCGHFELAGIKKKLQSTGQHQPRLKKICTQKKKKDARTHKSRGNQPTHPNQVEAGRMKYWSTCTVLISQ